MSEAQNSLVKLMKRLNRVVESGPENGMIGNKVGNERRVAGRAVSR